MLDQCRRTGAERCPECAKRLPPLARKAPGPGLLSPSGFLNNPRRMPCATLYEAEPAEEPRVCATCARYFDFDRMCNARSGGKLLRERFGIVLGGSEFAVEPEKSPTAPHG